MKKRINEIINMNSLISIDIEDFGDLQKIIHFRQDKIFDVNNYRISIEESMKIKSKSLVIHVECNKDTTLNDISKIINEIKSKFNDNCKIIYGTTKNNELSGLKIIDLFVMES